MKFITFFAVFLLAGISPGLFGEEARVTDVTGEEFVFEKPPARIVSLNPDFTDNLFALGAGDRVVGVTDFCRYPAASGKKASVGNLAQPNLEAIVSLKPDLVLATTGGNSPETVRGLRGLGLPVFVTGPSSTFQGYFDLLSRLGTLLNRKEAADALIGELRGEIERLRARAKKSPRVPVFFQVGVNPLISAGEGTLIDEMLEITGGKNIAAGSPLRYPILSLEKVLAEDPEVIVIAAMGSEAAGGRALWEKYPELRAVRNNRVFVVDQDLVCHLGPGLKEGLKKLANCLHPEWNEECGGPSGPR